MIKKHIITCTVILGLLVMAKVFAYNLPKAEKDNVNTTPITLNKPLEVAPKSLMERLNFANVSLPLGDLKVEKKMKKILAEHSHKKIQSDKLHKLADKWFPIIEPILAKYGIPDDFKYVPLVESGIKGGVSPKGAAGFWQFMPATARMYGLKVNGKVDERYDLHKSTVAASKYLRDLHNIFGNWALAAAAYNLGDVKLRRQIYAQKEDNYFKMKLNKETGGYVYKLISMKEIIDRPASYGYINSSVASSTHIE